MKHKRRPDGFSLTAMGVFALLIAAFMAIPIVTLVKTSLSVPQTGGFTLANYAEVFTKKLYQMSFINSISLSLQSSVYGMAIALVCSFALTRFAGEKTRNNLLVVVNMTSNFAGMPLAFALTLMLGNTGMFIILLDQMGLDLTGVFNLYYSVQGHGARLYLLSGAAGDSCCCIPSIRASGRIGRRPRPFWARPRGSSGEKSASRRCCPACFPRLRCCLPMPWAHTPRRIRSSAPATIWCPSAIGALISGDIRTRPELGSALAVTLALVLIAMMLLSDWAGRAARPKGDEGMTRTPRGPRVILTLALIYLFFALCDLGAVFLCHQVERDGAAARATRCAITAKCLPISGSGWPSCAAWASALRAWGWPCW